MLWAVVLPTSVSQSEEKQPPDAHPELKRLSPSHDVWIDIEKKQVVVGGIVCLDTGPIEYFACPKDTKDYESLVAVRSPARFVHAGLLAIGLTPGAPVSFNPDYTAASGPIVEIHMRWKDASGKSILQKAQDWVRDTRTGTAMTEQWVFAGSSFWLDPVDQKEYYQADGGDLVCLSNFPTAMLDLPIPLEVKQLPKRARLVEVAVGHNEFVLQRRALRNNLPGRRHN